MANGAALIRESLWHDRDFRALPRTAQCLYLQLLSQKDLDCAGVLTLNRGLLVKGCQDMTPANLEHDLKTLAQTRFIVVDEDSDEVLIRSYVRHVSVKSPNVWKAAKTATRRIRSPEICRMLASELRRLGRADANELANQIEPIRNPSGTVSEPFRNPIDTGNRSGTVPEPSVPVPVPVPVSPSVGGWVGEAPRGAPPPQKTSTNHNPDPEPAEHCKRHMPDGTDDPCRACQRQREKHTQWELAQEQAKDQQRLDLQNAIRNCDLCDTGGLFPIAPDRTWSQGYIECTHNAETNQAVIDDQ